MEFLVTMTTLVPEGTPEAAVDDIRTREAVRSQELAAERRPPLVPGEWRTLGLFEADDRASLEAVLLSMPLRIWRTDEVVPLSPHPNDPIGHMNQAEAPKARGQGSEFFTVFTISVPQGTPHDVVDAADAREADRARELAEQGRLLRLWDLPGAGLALGLWWAADNAEMEAILRSLPLQPWTLVKTTQLASHPSDPGLKRS
jgi:muconolactone delta-isomerase